jgi:hypothetical protein
MTLNLDGDVFEAAVRLSRLSGKRLGKVISEMARRGMARDHEQPRYSRKRFPTFRVPENAPIMPAACVQEVIDRGGYC